ncbi:MAG: protein kinase, partial [Myxococcales bacterium]|nr:protein kinase [Myxococcales bacterium]
VHRDVSPQNILVGIDGSSRITDFGVARAASRLSTTRSGQLKGKLSYMAPEQARGVAIDRRADIFAMGIVLWEVLAFKRLFKGEGEAETLNRVLYEPIPTLKSAVPTIPAALDAVVMKALEREPDKRFATAADFADALEAAARPLRTLASAKDVAACLDSVMGTDLQQQRDAVRAWLARSEPSRSQSKPRPSEVTRVEGSSRPSSPGAPKPDALEEAKKGAIAMSLDVSSVSSAVIQVPPPPVSQSSVGPAPPPRSRGPGPWIAGALGLLLLGGVGVGALQYGRSQPKSPAGGSDTAPGAASVATATASPPTDSVAAPTSAAVPSASATAAPPPTVATGRRPPYIGKPPPTGRGTTAPTPPPTAAAPPTTTATVPDDISRNPYR